MSRNQIKGLTVEIGGDTTKLGKALESVNKKSSDLSSELGEINRLLKFDPDNAELLAQKQKILAETIANTSDKLEKLREAERQVQRQFERGEVSEEQVRALRREILATEGQLKSYQKQADGATDETKDLGNEAEKTGGAIEGMGASLASVAKVGISAVTAGTSAVIGALVASAEATREYRTEMGKLTTAFETVGHRTEIAEEAYKRMYGVIGETDQTVEAAQQIALLAESEEDVVQWADLAAGVVARFGDALQPETFFEAANETIKLGEATGAYVQLLEGAGYNVDEFNAGLAACSTETEKQAYMLKITDELLGDAADLYRETNAEVIRATDANAAWEATLAEVGASVEPIITDVKLLGASLLGELMPGIIGVTDAFRGLINGEEGSAEAVGAALSTLLTTLLGKIIELLPTLTDAAISLLTSLITTLIGMIPTLINTAVEIVNALHVGLTQAFPLIIEAVVGMIPNLANALVSGIPQILDGAVQLLLAILSAIPLILPPLGEALPLIVLSIIDTLVAAIPQLLEGAFQFLMAIVEAIPLLISELVRRLPTILDTILFGILGFIPTLIDGAIKLFFSILKAIPEITAALNTALPSIIATIVTFLIKSIPELIKAGYQLMSGLVDGMLNFDIRGAISKVGKSVVDGFKKIFDIHSPSRVMAGLGELLDEGLAVGITDNANAPVNALDKLSEDMLDSTDTLNGVNLERRMTHSFTQGTASAATDGIATKLDQIYKAILSGQVIMLDSKTLIGSTAVGYDNELGQRRVLAERGAI